MADRGQAQGSLLDEALRSTTRAVASAPKVTLLLVLLVTGACVALSATHLGFKTDRSDLIDPNAPFQKRWLDYTQSFGTGSDIVVVVESEHRDVVRRAIESLGVKLSRETSLYSNVLYRIEATGLRRKGLQFLPPDRIRAVSEHLDRFQPVVQGRWDLIRLDDVTDRLAWQLSERSSTQRTGELLDQTERFTDSLSRFIVDPQNFQSPWPEMLPVDPQFQQATDQPVYLLSRSGTMGFIKAAPRATKSESFDGASRAVDRLRELAAEVTAEIPEARITLTGIPVLENDEMRRSSYDMTIASGVSFVGVGLLLLIGFRGLRHPILAMVMLAIGLSWAFGFATFSVGHLNILSVSFAAMLIGLGGDFAIHYLSHYLEQRHEGLDLADALEATSVNIGSGLITASLTTALAFFCATFTQFLGVAELGIIAGGGILLCALATFVALPALIALGDEGVPADQLPRPFRAKWLRVGTSKFPVTALVLSGAVIVGVTICAFRLEGDEPVPVVKFDHNLLNLQAEGIESVEVLTRLEAVNESPLFAVALADSPQEALALKARFEALPTVARVEELASKLPQAPPADTQRIVQEVRSRLSSLPAIVPRFEGPSPSSVGRSLERLYQVVLRIDSQSSRRIAAKLNDFLNRLEKLSFQDQSQLLGAFQQRSAQALLMQFQVLAMASDPTPLTAADLPQELTSRFIRFEGPRQTWLLQVYPKEEIWDFEPLSRFVSDVRSVDPNVTGTPLQNFEASRQIKSSYEAAALYALVVISLVLLLDFLERENKLLVLIPPLVVIAFTAMTLSTRGVPIRPLFLVLGYLGMVVAMAAVLDFRNLRDASLTLVPPIAAGAMTVGVLALLDQSFNAANLIVLPLILGIGVDNGVYVVHNARGQRGKQFTLDASTANAMAITSVTNMVGFGSLMIAAHRGLFSVGLVLTVGVACTLFVSLTTLPAILSWLSREPGVKKAKKSRDEMELEELEAATRPDRNRQQQRRAA